LLILFAEPEVLRYSLYLLTPAVLCHALKETLLHKYELEEPYHMHIGVGLGRHVRAVKGYSGSTANGTTRMMERWRRLEEEAYEKRERRAQKVAEKVGREVRAVLEISNVSVASPSKYGCSADR
jgi:hypothetical protein